jgi:nucleoside-diphosphate-sugar epimerase
VTVLVTGGSGLVGSHVIAALRQAGRPVRALVRAPAEAAVRGLGAEPIIGDVTDAAAWRRAADGARIAAIVHAAALVRPPRASLETYERVNVGGTALAVTAAREAGALLVHLSSVAVYGGSADLRAPGAMSPRDEDAPFRPLATGDYYARTKRAAEALVREAAERGEIDAVAIRPNVIYGERDRLFTPRVLRAVRGILVPQIGPGTNHLSCVYAGNVAQAIVAALTAAPRGFHAYLVTADRPPALTAREFLEAAASVAGSRPRFVRLPIPLARFAIALWSGPTLARQALGFMTGENPYRIERARTELGWVPEIDARDGLTRAGWWKTKGPGEWPGPRLTSGETASASSCPSSSCCCPTSCWSCRTSSCCCCRTSPADSKPAAARPSYTRQRWRPAPARKRDASCELLTVVAVDGPRRRQT